MSHSYTYRDVLAASERITWRVEDIIGPGKALDFDRAFLPESLARVDQLDFLAPCERRALNHIRGHGYLCMFLLAEQFILPFVMDHVGAQMQDNDYKSRALAQFASEEAKHIRLFKRFREEFEDGFGVGCDVIGPFEEIAGNILARHPLAVGLTILHIEWMTQSHYVDSIRDNQALDPQFRNLLRHHWMEEAQHAKLDTLIIEAMAATYDSAEIEQAVEEYVSIGRYLDDWLVRQVELDLVNLTAATGCRIDDNDKARFRRLQHQANRWTYLGSGMTHRNFLETLDGLNPAARARVEAVSPQFC